MSEKAKHASAKRIKVRDKLWPGSEGLVFNPSDRTTKGYAEVPRVVPLLARLVNEIGGAENAGPLYQVLWTQDWGQGVVEVRSFKGLLYEAGYPGKGTRVERTWEERIRILEKLGLIATAPRGLDNAGYILLIDPYLAALKLAADEAAVPALKPWLLQFNVFCEQWGIDLDAYRAKLTTTTVERVPS
jgi:hypothetical protein